MALVENKKEKIVIILGTTGVGKSALAVQIAESTAGEVVNADAMQCYKGLDIATNKPTKDEVGDVPHHLFGFVDPFSTEEFTVHKWTKLARDCIKDIVHRGRLPVIVGGTHYYIEALLWNRLIHEEQIKQETDGQDEKKKEFHEDPYIRLKRVDPVRAEKLHPNDKRKILRSLEIYDRTGTTHTALMENQGKSIEWQYDALILWPKCNSITELDQKLDSRVDIMAQRGLLEEFKEFLNLIDSTGKQIDCTRGLLQAIGARQFVRHIYSPETVTLEQALNDMKRDTRHYARSQTRFIRSRIADLVGDSLIELPVSSSPVVDAIVMKWLITNNIQPAVILPKKEPWMKFMCQICGKQLNGQNEWQNHLRSNKHRGARRSHARQLKREEYFQKISKENSTHEKVLNNTHSS